MGDGSRGLGPSAVGARSWEATTPSCDVPGAGGGGEFSAATQPLRKRSCDARQMAPGRGGSGRGSVWAAGGQVHGELTVQGSLIHTSIGAAMAERPLCAWH